MMNRGELAKSYFLKGYSCSQAIVLAFKDLINLDTKDILRISSPFGGGMSRLRETCGALTGSFIVLGYLYGSSTNDIKEKEDIYKRAQEIANKFKEKNGFIACRKLLNLDHESDDYKPEIRNKEYYLKRPCLEIIKNAGDILEEYINTHPYQL